MSERSKEEKELWKKFRDKNVERDKLDASIAQMQAQLEIVTQEGTDILHEILPLEEARLLKDGVHIDPDMKKRVLESAAKVVNAVQ